MFCFVFYFYLVICFMSFILVFFILLRVVYFILFYYLDISLFGLKAHLSLFLCYSKGPCLTFFCRPNGSPLSSCKTSPFQQGPTNRNRPNARPVFSSCWSRSPWPGFLPHMPHARHNFSSSCHHAELAIHLLRKQLQASPV